MTSTCGYSSMETVIRKLQTIWDDCCYRRRQQSEEEFGDYTLLRNDDMMMPEKEMKKMKQSRMSSEGCFGVYVGPERQRFVVKIEHANHPRFMALLQDAENEYGKSIHNNGPVYLPCDVDVFCETLAEIIISDFDSSVSDSPTSSHRSGEQSWVRRFFKIPILGVFNFKLNHWL